MVTGQADSGTATITFTTNDGSFTDNSVINATAFVTSNANLLFKTDFEGTVALGALGGGSSIDGVQYFSGSSTIDGTEWSLPIDGQLGLGSNNCYVHNIYGSSESNTYAGLDSTTGHDGNPTNALHTQIFNQSGAAVHSLAN